MARTPPPGKPKIAIAIGIPKGESGGSSGRSTPPPGIGHVEAHDTGNTAGAGKATREAALVVPEDHHCGQCANWDPTSGQCSKVEGSFSQADACLRYFAHANSADEEPDADDTSGGPPDQDSDDASMGAAS